MEVLAHTIQELQEAKEAASRTGEGPGAPTGGKLRREKESLQEQLRAAEGRQLARFLWPAGRLAQAEQHARASRRPHARSSDTLKFQLSTQRSWTTRKTEGNPSPAVTGCTPPRAAVPGGSLSEWEPPWAMWPVGPNVPLSQLTASSSCENLSGTQHEEGCLHSDI